MITKVTKATALKRLDKMKDEGAEWLSPEQVGDVLGYTRSWVWLNLRIVDENGKEIKDGKITAVQDHSRGKKKKYYMVHILSLEEDIEKRLYPRPPRS